MPSEKWLLKDCTRDCQRLAKEIRTKRVLGITFAQMTVGCVCVVDRSVIYKLCGSILLLHITCTHIHTTPVSHLTVPGDLVSPIPFLQCLYVPHVSKCVEMNANDTQFITNHLKWAEVPEIT